MSDVNFPGLFAVVVYLIGFGICALALLYLLLLSIVRKSFGGRKRALLATAAGSALFLVLLFVTNLWADRIGDVMDQWSIPLSVVLLALLLYAMFRPGKRG